MMLVMVAILITGGMALAYFGSRDNSIAIGVNVEAAARARVAAESGLDLAVVILETDSDWRTSHVDGVVASDISLGTGTVSITVIDSETDAPPTEETTEVEITVSASVDDLVQTAVATATIIEDEDEVDVDLSEFAIFAASSIEINGAARVAAWSASPLSANVGPMRIGTLSHSPMSVVVRPGARSNLVLHADETASSMLTTSAIPQEEFVDTPRFPDAPTAPSSGRSWETDRQVDHETSGHGWSSWFARGRHSSPWQSEPTRIEGGIYEVDEIHLGATDRVEIHGDVVVKVHDDVELHATEVVLMEDASLTIYVGGDLQILSSYVGDASGSRQSWMDPQRVQFYGTGEDAEWNIGGASTVKAEIYAPASSVEASGATTICGRIAADDVTLRGASRLLYDPLLDNGGYVDSDSPMFDEYGNLHAALDQLTDLDPATIAELLQSLDQDDDDNDWNSPHWRTEPTARPHDVIYLLLVYGSDIRHWEKMLRKARRSGVWTVASGDMQ